MQRSPAPRSSSVRGRVVRGVLTRVSVATLALAAAAQPPAPGITATPLRAPLQLARAVAAQRSHWRDDSDDRGAEFDKPLSGFNAKRAGSRNNTGSGGYNPQRVQRFWSHYHQPRPGPKEKPLEKQPQQK